MSLVDEDGWSRLDPKARLLFYLQSGTRFFLFQLPFSIALGIGATVLVSLVAGVVLASGVLFVQAVMALWMPTLSLDRWRFQLRDEDLLVQRGVLLRRTTSIPLTRIQHVDTQQGLWEQAFGLMRVEVFTASGFAADGVVPGVDVQTAERLRDQLIALTGPDDGL